MRVIIIGCGRMGAGLAETLALRGHEVVVVDREPHAFERLGPTFRGRAVTGVALDRATLVTAGVERCDALAALTASDDTNVVAARAARLLFRVPRVVARLYDPRKAERYRRLGVTTISTTDWGIHRIAELISYSDLDPLLSLGASVDIVDVLAPAALAGRRVADLAVPGAIKVVAISRGAATVLAEPGMTFESGDLLHLALHASAADQLRALLGR